MEGSQVVVLQIYVCLEVLFCRIVTVQFGHFPEEEVGIAFIPGVYLYTYTGCITWTTSVCNWSKIT
jgi:hypothetical protein